MEVVYDKAKGQADVPHRHDYYTVLFVEKAKGQHLIDDQVYDFSGQEVFFVSPGQIHQVALTARPKGWFFTFSRDFLIQNNIPESFISNINLFHAFSEAPPLSLDQKTYERLCNLVAEMQACFPMELNFRNRALGALLQLFLIYCNNSTNLNPAHRDEEHPGICILRDFKQMVEQKHKKWHKVGSYAEEIHISSKHLSHTIKNITGKSPKELIQDRLLLEGKRLLLHTELSVKEIAFELGYEEPLHFSAFFKKQSGTSPTEYRFKGRK